MMYPLPNDRVYYHLYQTLTLKEWAEGTTSSTASAHFLIRKVMLMFDVKESDMCTSDEWSEVANTSGVNPKWVGYKRN